MLISDRAAGTIALVLICGFGISLLPQAPQIKAEQQSKSALKPKADTEQEKSHPTEIAPTIQPDKAADAKDKPGTKTGEHEEEGTEFAKIGNYWIKISDLALIGFTFLLFLATGALGFLAWRQERMNKTLQRAYVSVKPAGIVSNTYYQILGHVVFENAGHLPAEDFSWRIKICCQPIRDWVPENLSSADLEGKSVLPVAAQWKMGSGSLDPRPDREHNWLFIYVWGRVEYKDGFGVPRFTNFCHRYPWARHEVALQGIQIATQISVDHARFHKHGNKAN